MGKIKDITGWKFGKYTVISFAGLDTRKQATWQVLCECGTVKTIPARSLVHDRVMSCGCYLRQRIQETHRKPDGIAAQNATYASYKKSAHKRELSFTLTEKEFLELTQQVCHYCGSIPENKTVLSSGEFVYNGIDRKDNTLGYELTNCLPCCGRCNRAKGTMSYNEFMQFVANVFNYRNGI